MSSVSRPRGRRPGECSVLEAAYIIIIRGDKGRGHLGLAWGSNGGVELLPSGQPGGSCGLRPGKGLSALIHWQLLQLKGKGGHPDEWEREARGRGSPW